MKTANLGRLEACFGRIKEPAQRRLLWRGTAARAVTPGSVMRVFWSLTRLFVVDHLVAIDVDVLPSLSGQEAYRRWFEHEVRKLGDTISTLNPSNNAIRPGITWGHAAKILNLYIRELVCYRPYFNRRQADRIEPWLYVPTDSEVLVNLAYYGAPQKEETIREVATAKQFFRIQGMIGRAARQAGARRIWFDDLRGELDGH